MHNDYLIRLYGMLDTVLGLKTFGDKFADRFLTLSILSILI